MVLCHYCTRFSSTRSFSLVMTIHHARGPSSSPFHESPPLLNSPRDLKECIVSLQTWWVLASALLRLHSRPQYIALSLSQPCNCRTFFSWHAQARASRPAPPQESLNYIYFQLNGHSFHRLNSSPCKRQPPWRSAVEVLTTSLLDLDSNSI